MYPTIANYPLPKKRSFIRFAGFGIALRKSKTNKRRHATIFTILWVLLNGSGRQMVFASPDARRFSAEASTLSRPRVGSRPSRTAASRCSSRYWITYGGLEGQPSTLRNLHGQRLPRERKGSLKPIIYEIKRNAIHFSLAELNAKTSQWKKRSTLNIY